MKSLDGQTLETLAEIICGDGTEWYRRGSDLPRFFRNSGLQCPDHDNTTRKWWALARLHEYNKNTLYIQRILLRLADPLEYRGNASVVNEVINKLNIVLAIEGFKILLEGVAPRIAEITPTTSEPNASAKLFAVPTPDFAKITRDTSLSPFIEGRWKEVIKCVDCESYLAATILMGSILEGVLLAIIQSNKKESNQARSAPRDKNGNVKSFGDWYLSNLIDVAHECGWLQLDVKKFSHTLREYRNLVHPWEQRARNEVPDEDTCKICWQVVGAAINDLQKPRC
jgi:hypothetical protein